MRFLGTIFILLTILFYGTRSYYQVHNYEYMSDRVLEQDYRSLANEIREHDEKMTTPMGGHDRLSEMRQEKVAMWLEWRNRTWGLSGVIPVLGGLGLFLIFLPTVLAGWEKKRASKIKARVSHSDEGVREAPSREEYVDEWEFHRRIEGAFQSREEAIEWLLHDPLLKCDYCGGRLNSTYEGDREALQMVTFYKAVPEGARDLRIVLGSYWFALTASEIKCSSCNRTVRR